MALFESLALPHLSALLRQGFASRLRSETSDIYLSQKNDVLVSTDRRAEGSIFFFITGDGPLTAVLARRPEGGDPRFLSLPETPTLTTTPNLLKLNLVDKDRCLFSVSRVTPPAHISLHQVSLNAPAKLRQNCSKWELFHLEILPDSIGKGFLPDAFQDLSFMSFSQALTHAFLQLGSRFRLRSVHSRVLQFSEDNCIHNDSPNTDVASSHDSELLLTAFLSAENISDAAHAYYALQHVQSGKRISLSSPNFKLADDSQKVVHVRASPNGWGTVSLASEKDGKVMWLMAGPRGRLDMRNRPGAWETFTIELVRQSYDAALRDIPVPAIYKVAEIATRSAVREQIAARVAAAKGDENEKKQNNISKGSNFNFAKALAGFSDDVKPSSSAATSAENASGTSGSKKKTTKSGGGNQAGKSGARGGATPALAAATATGLPRNKASKKASKKSKRKKAKKAAAKAAARNTATGGGQDTPSASSSTEVKSAAEADGDNVESKKSDDSKASSSTETAAAGSGPPCSACGRALSGGYTKALGKSFHPHCFCCGFCRRPMGAGASQFRERGGIPYCNSCYASKLASRCARCSQPILETVVTAMEKTWHKDCLTCTICRLPLTQTFWLYADKPNEPRCSRCVTGDENYTSNNSSRRMVNLPMFGSSGNTPSFPMNGPTNTPGAVGGAGQGRARLLAPTLPPTRRR